MKDHIRKIHRKSRKSGWQKYNIGASCPAKNSHLKWCSHNYFEIRDDR